MQNLNQAEQIYRNSKDYINNSKENNTNMTPVMFVTKDADVQGDFFMESEAEEIYVPD